VSDAVNLDFWEPLNIVLAIAMPCLLAASAFFSGAETAIFGMTARQRLDLAATHGQHSPALRLLREPRLLLITLLLGNMVVNVLYFVLASVIAWNQPWGMTGAILFPVLTLLGLVLFGEVAPKMIASSRNVTVARLVGPALLAMHGTILPIRAVLDRLVVRPLAQLATPSHATTALKLGELDALINSSAADGLVDQNDQRLLADVLSLGRMKLGAVMTPRTKMVAIPIDGDADAIRALIHKHRLMRIPVRGKDLDDILGFLHVKDWLRKPSELRALLRAPIYLPEVTTVDRALETMRTAECQTAVVVDEYGGTAGVVSLHDLIEPLVGEIADDTSPREQEARPLGPGRWIVPGDFRADRLVTALFRQRPDLELAATVGGLLTRRLGRRAEIGDRVVIANVTIEVHHVDDTGQVETAIVSLEDKAS
jgi:putative hemolysin